MRQRLNALLYPLALTVGVILASLLIVGPLMGQTTLKAAVPAPNGSGFDVKLTYTVPVHDSLVVTRQLAGSNPVLVARYGKGSVSSYTRTVYIGPTVLGAYTFKAKRYLGTIRDSGVVVMAVGNVTPPPPPAPTLAILDADTSAFTRVAGDTTFTTRQIVTTRGVVDTAVTMTYTVKPPVVVPPVVTVTPLDSVTVAAVTVRDDWDSTKVSMSPHAWPYPQAGASMTGSVLMDGVVVGKIQQTALYTTVNVPRPIGKAVTFTVCVSVKATLPASATICSRPRPYTDRAIVGAVTPPADTTHYLGSLASLAAGPVVTDSGFYVAARPSYTGTWMLPVWAHYTGTPIRVIVRDSIGRALADVKITERGTLPTALAGLAANGPVGLLRVPSGFGVMSVCAEVPATDSLVYRLCTPAGAVAP